MSDYWTCRTNCRTSETKFRRFELRSYLLDINALVWTRPERSSRGSFWTLGSSLSLMAMIARCSMDSSSRPFPFFIAVSFVISSFDVQLNLGQITHVLLQSSNTVFLDRGLIEPNSCSLKSTDWYIISDRYLSNADFNRAFLPSLRAVLFFFSLPHWANTLFLL